jgi:cell wall assembly regulator SMI1
MATSWRDLIERAYADIPNPAGTTSKPRFSPPVSTEDIAAAEDQLGTKLPASLTSLLMETDGVMDMMSVRGGDYFANMWLIWPTERIVAESLEDRSEYVLVASDADTSDLVFFADAGADGILFAFPPASANTGDTKVVAWHPLRGTVSDLADSLEDFIARWLTGRISV